MRPANISPLNGLNGVSMSALKSGFLFLVSVWLDVMRIKIRLLPYSSSSRGADTTTRGLLDTH